MALEIGLAIFSGATQVDGLHKLGAGTTQHTSMAIREQVAILQGFGEKWPLMDPYLRSQESQRHVVRQWYAWIYTDNWNRGMASEDACQFSLKSGGPSKDRWPQEGSAGRRRSALTIEELLMASKKGDVSCTTTNHNDADLWL